MADRGLLTNTPHERRAASDDPPAHQPGPTQFPSIRRALCRTLDAGRHWSARNMIAACGTWRELKALFGRDLPTHDAGILRVRLDADGAGISILTIDPFERLRGPAVGEPIAHLVEGVDY